MRHDRIVIGYHGCDEAIAHRLVSGESFRKSKNDFDWLGEGIYFWEYGLDRALQFAHEQQRRGKVERPSVVGALLHLGNCFDLMDTHFTSQLSKAFDQFRAVHESQGRSMPVNGGGTPDLLLRRRDSAVFNFLFDELASEADAYDSVRGCFNEGGPVYEGSGISTKSHVQIAIRNEACIVGLFHPRELRSLHVPTVPQAVLRTNRPH